MTTPPSPPVPKLPPRKISAMLVAAMLAVGIAMGALIGPGGAGSIASLASSSRVATLGRLLALLALGSGTSSGSAPLLSSGATGSPPAINPQPTPATNSEAATASGKAASNGKGGAVGSQPHSSSGAPARSPTSSGSPASGGEEETEKAKTPLPPIADAWLIELPYGSGVEKALTQNAAAPYLNGQLKSEGAVLSSYSSLAAAQLAGAATLLSGQVGASVTTLTPPTCSAAAASAPAAANAASGAGNAAGTGGAAGTGSAIGPGGAPCPAGEPAGLQAADAFLQEAVPKILASALYKEHGLIVITFAPSATPSSTVPATPGAGTGEGAITYPPGSAVSTLGASGASGGALVLSPFLSHAGTRTADSFNPLAPRESLQALLRSKPAG